MPAVQLPAELVEQIAHNLTNGGTVDEFVRDAVEEKLGDAQRRREFHRLTTKIREARLAKGLTEEEILAEFDRHRNSQGRECRP